MQRADRMGWIEWARALGALGVVLLHVCTSTELVVDVEPARMLWHTVAGIVFGRWAVPGFFMITGFLLLDPARDVSWSRAVRYAKRMVLVLATFGLAFSLMEEAWTSLQASGGASLAIVPAAVVDVLTASSWDHLWYVYALVFVYLLVPAIRMLRDRVGERRFSVFALAFCAVVLVMPTIVCMVVTAGGGEVNTPQQGLVALAYNVAIGLACFCVGGCLRAWKPGPAVWAIGGMSLAIMLTTSVWGILTCGNDQGFVFLQGSCFACAYAVAVLMALRKIVGVAPLAQGSAIDKLARDSFGIYVLHPVFVHAVLLAMDPAILPEGVFEVCFFVVVLVASVVATRLVRRIPWLGELL